MPKKQQKTEYVVSGSVGLGNAICMLRLQKQLTRKKLSERCGLSINFLYRIEKNNRRPSITALRRIAAGLRVTMDDLTTMASANISSTETRVFQIIRQLEDLSDKPGIKEAVSALTRTFPGR